MNRRAIYSQIELLCRVAYFVEWLLAFVVFVLRPADQLTLALVACAMMATFALFVYVRRQRAA
jgi:hypothetical protein